MAVLLYDRRVSVEVRPATFIGTGQGRRLATPWNQVLPYPGLGPIAEGLRVRFSAEKSIESVPNRATIEIFNLKPENRVLPKKDDLVTLRAGYAGDIEAGGLPIIFRGNLTTSTPVKEGQDWILKLASGDGASAIKKGRIVDLVPKGAGVGDVFDRLKKKLEDLGTEVMSDFGESIIHWIVDQFSRSSSAPNSEGTGTGGEAITGGPRALVGKVTDILTEECDKVGLSWSVQNNILIIRPKGGDDAQPPIILNASTGLIKVARTEKGVAGQALLISGMEPGRKVEILSPYLTSLIGAGPPAPQQFILTKTRLRGDTHGNDFFVDFEALPEGETILLSGAG